MTVATAARRDADEDRLDELRAPRRLEVAEEHREQQDDLEPLAEQDQERLARHQRRRANAGVGDGPLGLVEHAAQFDDLVPDLVDRSIVLDRGADRRELELRLAPSGRCRPRATVSRPVRSATDTRRGPRRGPGPRRPLLISASVRSIDCRVSSSRRIASSRDTPSAAAGPATSSNPASAASATSRIRRMSVAGSAGVGSEVGG